MLNTNLKKVNESLTQEFQFYEEEMFQLSKYEKQVQAKNVDTAVGLI